MITATRHHDFSAGHRVAGHESKCAFLHGHNYRVHFTCQAASLDSVGRVLDFSSIKSRLCQWLEQNWDHKFLAWVDDPLLKQIARAVNAAQLDKHSGWEAAEQFHSSIVWTPFNPTAEKMADYLLRIIGPQQLAGTGVTLISVQIDETRKCSAYSSLDSTSCPL